MTSNEKAITGGHEFSETTGRLRVTLVPLDWCRLFLSLALLVASGIFTTAEAQFSNGYSFRREVDFVDAEVIGGPHTNFPVLIDSTLLTLRTTADGGKVENANGYDIIFTSDQAGATQLSHEIERYDAVTGEIVFWVRVESLAATTSIYMFYGNSSIATFQGDVTSNGVTGVWDDDYLGVWHLNEDVVDEATGATHFDSTSNNNDGIQQENVEAAAKIADGQDFDGTGDYIEDADGELYINGLTAFTVSLWIQSDLTGIDKGFIIGKTPDNQDDIFGLRYDSKGADGGGTDVIKAAITVSGQFPRSMKAHRTYRQPPGSILPGSGVAVMTRFCISTVRSTRLLLSDPRRRGASVGRTDSESDKA